MAEGRSHQSPWKRGFPDRSRPGLRRGTGEADGKMGQKRERTCLTPGFPAGLHGQALQYLHGYRQVREPDAGRAPHQPEAVQNHVLYDAAQNGPDDGALYETVSGHGSVPCKHRGCDGQSVFLLFLRRDLYQGGMRQAADAGPGGAYLCPDRNDRSQCVPVGEYGGVL